MFKGYSDKQKYHFNRNVVLIRASVKPFSGTALQSMISPSLHCLKKQHANLSSP